MNKLLIGAIVPTAFGTVLVIVGLVLRFGVIPSATKKGIEDALIFDPNDEEQIEKWKTPYNEDDIPKYSDIYIFNITNLNEYLNGCPPLLEQLGPYVFRQYTTFYNVSFTEDGNEIIYSEHIKYIFQPEMSQNFSLTDKIITYNHVYVAFMENFMRSETVGGIYVGSSLVSTVFKTLNNTMYLSALAFVHGSGLTVTEMAGKAPPSTNDAYKIGWAKGTNAAGELNLPSNIGVADPVAVAVWEGFFDTVNILPLWLGKSSFNSTTAQLAHQALKGLYSLTDDQVNVIYGWFGPHSIALAVASVGGALENIKYHHWGTGVTGLKGRDLEPSLAMFTKDVEFSYFWGGAVSYDYAASKLIFSLFFEPTNPSTRIGYISTFLTQAQTMSSAALATAWGLPATPDPKIYLAGYLAELVKADMTCANCFAGKLMALSPLFIEKTAGELLSGWTDALTGYGPSWTGILPNTSAVEDLASKPPTYVHGTGKNGMDDLWRYHQYKGQSMITFFGNEPFPINTTYISSQYPPFVEEGEILTMMETSLYHPIPLKPSGLKTQIYGIDVSEYIVADTALASSEEHPPNAIYNQGYHGAVNYTAAGLGRIFFSLPHMYNGEPRLMDTVRGLHPNGTLHNVVLYINTLFGSALSGNRRLQFNTEFVPTDVNYKNIPEYTMFPRWWIDQHQTVSEKVAGDVRDALDKIELAEDVSVGVAVAGGVVTAAGVGLFAYFLSLQHSRRPKMKSHGGSLYELAEKSSTVDNEEASSPPLKVNDEAWSNASLKKVPHSPKSEKSLTVATERHLSQTNIKGTTPVHPLTEKDYTTTHHQNHPTGNNSPGQGRVEEEDNQHV
eukprot:GCRY01000680.1.p1 GENE.GCRY01000680.1~~GCRY01000680.1.p1  ORF type:complete len:840 (-),score=218.29 GCRY01000680.1:804-3323(-)